jgi:hypothetical protein
VYFYSAYGLNIGSAIPLRDLIETHCRPDVLVSYRELTNEFVDICVDNAPAYETPGCTLRISEKGTFFRWTGLGKILILNGTEIMVEPHPGTAEDDLLPFLTGPALISLLIQRRFLVLHASAVVVDGTAIAFLGSKGFGKSTLAAYMHAHGHSLISDDIVPVTMNRGRAMTAPGYPRIKLYPDSVKAVGSDPATLPFIHRLIDKHSYKCQEDFYSEPVDLSAIYILAEDSEIGISRLGPMQSFIEIAKYTHANRYLKESNTRKHHFEQCQNLISAVPVFSLKRPHRFEHIDEVRRVLVEHVAEGCEI